MAKPKQVRLDLLLVEQGLAPSRTRAQSIIMAGLVDVNGQRIDKPGAQVGRNADITVRDSDRKYVSRGGVKLAAALENFGVDPTARICIDLGASTGGFTDALLQAGAAKVYAVDVGYGQLNYALRNDKRVVVLERENIRHLDGAKIDEPPSLAVIDVSFIGLALIFPKVVEVAAHPAEVIALVKPQFEAGPADVGKGGIVRDPDVRARVLEEVKRSAESFGLEPVGEMESPITGAKGNVEFLVHFKTRTGT